MYREQVLRFLAGVPEFFPELDNDLIQGARGAGVMASPGFHEQAVSRQYLARVGIKQLEQFQFSRREGGHSLAYSDLKSFRVYGRQANLKRAIRRRLCLAATAAPQEGMNACNEFPDAERFGQVIVRA